MKKRAKASEAYDAQKFTEIRHTAARSLDTEKMGHGFIFFQVCAMPNRYNLRNRGLRDVHIHIHIHLYCSKHYVYSDSPPKTNASAGPESLLD